MSETKDIPQEIPREEFLNDFAQRKFCQEALHIYTQIIDGLGQDMSLSENISFAEKLGALKDIFENFVKTIAHKVANNDEKIVEARDLFMDDNSVKESLTSEEYKNFIWLFSDIVHEQKKATEARDGRFDIIVFPNKEKASAERAFELYKKIALEVYDEIEKQSPEIIPPSLSRSALESVGMVPDMDLITGANFINSKDLLYYWSKIYSSPVDILINRMESLRTFDFGIPFYSEFFRRVESKLQSFC